MGKAGFLFFWQSQLVIFYVTLVYQINKASITGWPALWQRAHTVIGKSLSIWPGIQSSCLRLILKFYWEKQEQDWSWRSNLYLCILTQAPPVFKQLLYLHSTNDSKSLNKNTWNLEPMWWASQNNYFLGMFFVDK
jgi:hypothetical protein